MSKKISEFLGSKREYQIGKRLIVVEHIDRFGKLLSLSFESAPKLPLDTKLETSELPVLLRYLEGKVVTKG